MATARKPYVRTQYSICRRSDYNMLHAAEKLTQELCAAAHIKQPKMSRILKQSSYPESLCDEFVCESNEE